MPIFAFQALLHLHQAHDVARCLCGVSHVMSGWPCRSKARLSTKSGGEGGGGEMHLHETGKLPSCHPEPT